MRGTSGLQASRLRLSKVTTPSSSREMGLLTCNAQTNLITMNIILKATHNIRTLGINWS